MLWLIYRVFHFRERNCMLKNEYQIRVFIISLKAQFYDERQHVFLWQTHWPRAPPTYQISPRVDQSPGRKLPLFLIGWQPAGGLGLQVGGTTCVLLRAGVTQLTAALVIWAHCLTFWHVRITVGRTNWFGVQFLFLELQTRPFVLVWV